MDKHLLAENPMRAPEGGLAIIRTIQPISFYEVIEGWKEFNSPHKNYTYKGSDEIEEHFTLIVRHYFSTDVDTIEQSEVYKFMDDAWYWFMAYMKWEDEQNGLR